MPEVKYALGRKPSVAARSKSVSAELYLPQTRIATGVVFALTDRAGRRCSRSLSADIPRRLPSWRPPSIRLHDAVMAPAQRNGGGSMLYGTKHHRESNFIAGRHANLPGIKIPDVMVKKIWLRRSASKFSEAPRLMKSPKYRVSLAYKAASKNHFTANGSGPRRICMSNDLSCRCISTTALSEFACISARWWHARQPFSSRASISNYVARFDSVLSPTKYRRARHYSVTASE